MKKRCLHWSPRGYGRCVLGSGHLPVENGSGVWYAHQYEPAGRHGPFDASEMEGKLMDPCSACGRDNVVRWSLVRHVQTNEPFWRWVCIGCGANRVIPVAS